MICMFDVNYSTRTSNAHRQYKLNGVCFVLNNVIEINLHQNSLFFELKILHKLLMRVPTPRSIELHNLYQFICHNGIP